MRTLQDLRSALLKRWWRLTVPGRLRRRGCSVGDGCTFYGMPLVTRVAGSAIRFGPRVTVASHSLFTALGVSRPTIFRAMRPEARIEIGADTGMSGAVICAAISVSIGSECLLGADVLIADTDFHPIRAEGRRYGNDPRTIAAAPVSIGDRVFIGGRSLVLKGVTIGSNSVIGAGSVVVKDIPPNVIAAGNPARVIRELPA